MDQHKIVGGVLLKPTLHVAFSMAHFLLIARLCLAMEVHDPVVLQISRLAEASVAS